MPIDKQNFRHALGHFAAGVTVVTTVGSDGRPYGLTATAFTSVSLDPPLILVCIDKGAESYPHLMTAAAFSVSFLGANQQPTSNQFARSGIDKFEGIATNPGATGAPWIDGALAHLDCRVAQRVDAGDHTIFVGEVEAAEVFEGEPLVYYNSAYRKIVG